MKKSILLFALILTGLSGIAQDTYNLVLFSEDGDPFFAFVNGIRQNDKPETNIKVTGLNSQALSVRVQFENGALPILKQNMAPETGYEHTVRIRKNAKKVMKMQYFGKVALNEAPRTNASTIKYHTAENPMDNGAQSEVISNEGESVTMTTASTTVNTSSPNATTVTMNSGGVGITMNVTTTEETVNHSTTVNSSHTVSTSTQTLQPRKNNHGVTSSTITTTSSSGTIHPRSQNVSAGVKPTTTLSPAASSITPRPINPALTTTITPATSAGCVTPMDDAVYQKLKTSIDEKPFEDNKMSIAKVGTKGNCLSVDQIKGICELFSIDDHKLAYAKYAYPFCMDKGNYFQVNDVFTFPRTTENMNKFLQQQK